MYKKKFKQQIDRERKNKLKIEKIANESTSENEIIIGEKKIKKKFTTVNKEQIENDGANEK
jgi:hypothetical protein